MKPTYEVVGKIERFDERDTVFAREALIAGSEEERLYHEQNPHLREIDERIRKFIDEKLATDRASWGRAYYQVGFRTLAYLALPDCVDGEPAPDAIKIDPKRASLLVKGLASHLGADVVGITRLKQEWVYSHRGTRPFFADQPPNPPLFEGMPDHYTGRLWGDPIHLEHQYAIALAFTQDLRFMKAGPGVASDLEVGKVYARSALVACQLASFIRALGFAARAHHVRNYYVLVVPIAVDAGLGELSRAGYLLNKTYGLNLRLSCVTTDLPLKVDEPIDIGVQEFCSKCLKCARNCPAGAIPTGDKTIVRGIRKWRVDAERCLLYWGRVGAACQICQVVCPWSKPPTYFHRAVANIASKFGGLTKFLVKADDLFYGTKYKQVSEPLWMHPDGEGGKSQSDSCFSGSLRASRH